MIILKIIKSQFFWLGLILILGIFVRLYKIDAPIADWHSWRQADTAAVTRNFIKEGFNPFFPKYDDMSGVSETPISNPQRFRLVEFPIYNIAVYPFYLLFGVDVMFDRLVSVLFTLGSIIFVYLIAKRFLGKLAAFFSALIFALLPFSVFFSRTTLPEPTFLFFALGMIYFVEKWIWENKKKWGILGFIFTASAFLIKPWAFFFILPLIYSIFKKENKKIPSLKYILFFILALSPFFLWRFWIAQQPEGIPASSWLFNGDGIRFRPAHFWWIVSERLGREILAVTGLFLLVVGVLVKAKNYFLHIWFVGIILYFIIVATGNVRHDYYQFIATPILCIFVAKGFLYLFKGNPEFIPRVYTIILALLFLPLTFYFGYKQVKDLYQINNPAIVEVGKRADQLLPKNAIVLAPYNGDTAFLYQTNRAGFAVYVLPIKEMVADFGVTHFVTTSKDEKANWVKRHFEIIEEADQYLIADLTKLIYPLTELDPEP